MTRCRSRMQMIAVLGLTLLVSQIGTSAAMGAPSDLANLRLQKWTAYPETLSYPARSVVVAVIDTGVSLPSHLKKQVLAGINIEKPLAHSVDKVGHGTAVAGIVLEVAPNALILPIMVAGDGQADIQSLIDGMVYAINQGAKIINISMQCPLGLLDEVARVVGTEKVKETLFVVAAGNSGTQYQHYEKTPDNVLVVGATELDSARIAGYSDWGEQVEIAAPSGANGDGITTYKIDSETQRRVFNGTSGAAPVVSGAAALLLAQEPELSAIELKTAILQSSCSRSTLKNIIAGARMLHIGRLLKQTSDCGN